jgi:hypothetical protein
MFVVAADFYSENPGNPHKDVVVWSREVWISYLLAGDGNPRKERMSRSISMDFSEPDRFAPSWLKSRAPIVLPSARSNKPQLDRGI